MKIQTIRAAAAALFLGTAGAVHSATESLSLSTLPAPSGDGQFVEVTIGPELIAFAATLAAQKEPDAARLLSELRKVEVRVVSLDDTNREQAVKQVGDLRESLKGGGWSKVVTARDGGDDVQVFMRVGGGEVIEGLVVTVLSGDGEAVCVHVDGSLNAKTIAALQQRFNVPGLDAATEAVRKAPVEG